MKLFKSVFTLFLLAAVSLGVETCPQSTTFQGGGGGARNGDNFRYGSSFETTSLRPRASAFPQVGGGNQQVDWVRDRLRYWISLRGQSLINSVPADIADYCPNYAQLNRDQRTTMWAVMMTEMVRFESNYNPRATHQEPFNDSRGRPVISSGLFQISLESSQGYGCPVSAQNDLFDPDRNIMCSVQIMNRLIERDNRIGGGSVGNRGGARYWAVLRNARPAQRRAITAATRQYCASGQEPGPEPQRQQTTPVSS